MQPNSTMSSDELLLFIRTEIAAETGRPLESITADTPFHQLGLDSLSAVLILHKIEAQYKIDVNPIVFWDYPTPSSFAEFVSKQAAR